MIKHGWQDRDFVRTRTEGFDAFARSLDGLDLDGIEAVDGPVRGRDRGPGPTPVRGRERHGLLLFGHFRPRPGNRGHDLRPVPPLGQGRTRGCGVNPVTGVSNIVGSYDVGAACGFLPGHRRAEDKAAGKTPDELLAADPTPLKALVVADHDEEIIRNAERIKGLEFVVYLGAYRNPFTDLAHIVLPTATYAEADGTYTNTERRIQLNREKVEPPAGARPAWRIYADIAAKRGASWLLCSAEDVMAEIARPCPRTRRSPTPRSRKASACSGRGRRPSRRHGPPVGRGPAPAG